MGTQAQLVKSSSPEQRVLETRSLLEKAAQQIVDAMPKHLRSNDEKGERFRRIILSLVNGPRMDRVTPRNFVIGAIRAAEIGLEPDPFYGHLYLIPYGEKLQPQIGYKGMMELAWRSDRVRDITAEVVWKEDKFIYKITPREKTLEHEPNLDVEHDPKKETPRCVYAIARLKDGGEAIVVLPAHEVYRRRDRSQSVQAAKKYGKQTPWDTDEVAMWKKTAIRALAPWIPQCPQIANAMRIEDEAEKEIVDVTFTPMIEESIQGTEETSTAIEEGAPQQPGNQPAGDPEPVKKEGKAGGLTVKDLDPKERGNVETWMWVAKGLNKAAVADWIANWQGTKQELLAEAEELSRRSKDGRE